MSRSCLSQSAAPSDHAPLPARKVPRWWWLALLVVYLGSAVTYSLIQPLGGPPDEVATVRVIKFLAQEHRLPLWNPVNGGEAGYEDQHPPLMFAVLALVYRLASALPEQWRWYLLRWVDVLVGLAGLLLTRSLFCAALPHRPRLAWAGVATAALFPATLDYASHINPDLWVMAWFAAGMWLTFRLLREPENLRLAAGLGAVCGLAIITKVSALPLLAVALLAELWPALEAGRERRRVALKSAALTLAATVLVSGWWFARNEYYYALLIPIGQIHHLGTGLDLAFRAGFGYTAWLTIRETYLSTFIPTTWPPAGAATVLSYGLVSAALALGLAGLIARRARRPASDSSGPDPLRLALNLSGLAVVLAVLAHQWSFWMTDVEKNMGGRYLLEVLPALALLVVVGIGQWRKAARVALPAWLVALLLINVLSAWNIVTVLNPRYFPGWHMFQAAPSTDFETPTGPSLSGPVETGPRLVDARLGVGYSVAGGGTSPPAPSPGRGGVAENREAAAASEYPPSVSLTALLRPFSRSRCRRPPSLKSEV